jgi:hypothetical protein
VLKFTLEVGTLKIVPKPPEELRVVPHKVGCAFVSLKTITRIRRMIFFICI